MSRVNTYHTRNMGKDPDFTDSMERVDYCSFRFEDDHDGFVTISIHVHKADSEYVRKAHETDLDLADYASPAEWKGVMAFWISANANLTDEQAEQIVNDWYKDITS